MRSFRIPCTFEDRTVAFPLYVGEPVADSHPLEQQLAWLERERGGRPSEEVVGSFAALHRIAVEHGARLEELAVYAMDEAAVAPPPASATPAVAD